MHNFHLLSQQTFLISLILFITQKSVVSQDVNLFTAVSTAMNERDMAISSDGQDLFYSVGHYNHKRRVMVHMNKKNGKWSDPEIVKWSGIYHDIEPFISPEGDQLYFASTRPIFGDSIRTDYNIWVCNKSAGKWSDPVPLDSMINTRADEFYPSLGKSKNIYYTAEYKGGIGKEDIYMSAYINGKYVTPQVLDTNVNSKTYEFNAYVTPSEDTIIYTSYGRKDDLGGGDLYMNIKNKNGVWQPAIHFNALINSSSLDYCPFIDLPRKTFYFTSNRGGITPSRIEKFSDFLHEVNQPLNGLDNIYSVPLSSLSK